MPEEMSEANPPSAWSVSTIASLITWIDENSARLGQSHINMVLDLATFAGLMPKEAQEALLKVTKLVGSRRDKDSSSPSVNDLLVALRQLESILDPPEEVPVSLPRRRRSAGGRR
jgi:hypothetical protein